ncbi:hypothetical protein NW768_002952 [Fusarium equiseti]|uniref:Uncharacterized protein n=1 Tax=Fusarium equiseti TaxID=61235 RepID=A0ABQ8RKS8_FUSEQ|nr:hypothetical protein NW768_002952 [Fusarium equiseti]
MSSKVASVLATTVYTIWCIQWGFLTATFCIYHELSIPNPFYAVLTTVLTLPIPLLLWFFLLYTTASRFPSLDSRTRKFNKFFYETRDWAMILPMFSILWFINVLWWGLLFVMDLFSNGPLSKCIGLLYLLLNVVGTALVVLGMIVYTALPIWVVVTGFGAFRRVWNLKSPGEEEATRLTAKDGDEEWNDFQDDRGN